MAVHKYKNASPGLQQEIEGGKKKEILLMFRK